MDLGDKPLSDITVEDVHRLTSIQKEAFMLAGLRAVGDWHMMGMLLPFDAMKRVIDIELTSTEMDQSNTEFFTAMSDMLQIFCNNRELAQKHATKSGVSFQPD